MWLRQGRGPLFSVQQSMPVTSQTRPACVAKTRARATELFSVQQSVSVTSQTRPACVAKTSGSVTVQCPAVCASDIPNKASVCS